MNNFLENKQNLIMIGQSIIMLGVSVYFYKRIQAVVYNIGELHKMILNQQDQINKQNMVIENLRTLVLNNSEKNNKVLQEAKVFVKLNKIKKMKLLLLIKFYKIKKISPDYFQVLILP